MKLRNQTSIAIATIILIVTGLLMIGELFPTKVYSATHKLDAAEVANAISSDNVESSEESVNLLTSDIVIDDMQLTQGLQFTNENLADPSGCPQSDDSSNIHMVRNEDGTYKPMALRIAARATGDSAKQVNISATLEFFRPVDLDRPDYPERVPIKFDSNSESIINMGAVEVGRERLDLTDKKGIVIDIGDLRDELRATPYDAYRERLIVKNADKMAVTVTISEKNDPSKSVDCTRQYHISVTQTPQIFFHSVKFPDPEPEEPATATISNTHAAEFVKGIFPVADSENFYRKEPYNTFYCPVIDILTEDKISDNAIKNAATGKSTKPSEACVVLHHLATLRNALATCGYGPDPLTLVYGWSVDQPGVDDDPVILGNGYASHGGRVGFGNTLAIRGQRTFAHEVLHMLGRGHPTRQFDTLGRPIDFEKGLFASGWDTVGSPAQDSTDRWKDNGINTRLKDPLDLYDILVPGVNTNQAWISAKTYEHLLGMAANFINLVQDDCIQFKRYFEHRFRIESDTGISISELNSAGPVSASLRNILKEDLLNYSDRSIVEEGIILSLEAEIISIKEDDTWLISDDKVIDDSTNPDPRYRNRHALYILQKYEYQDDFWIQIVKAKDPNPSVGIQFCIADEDNGEGFTAIPFPAIIWPWTLQSPTTPIDQSERFTVSVETDQTLTGTYDARIGTDDPDNDMIYGFISAEIPAEEIENITQVSITGPNGPVPIFDRTTGQYENVLVNGFAEQPFSIEITSPSPSEVEVSDTDLISLTEIEVEFNIEWEITDDFDFVRDEDQFEYQVLYSHDGGRIWVPLAVNLPGFLQVITVDREQLCATGDRENYSSGADSTISGAASILFGIIRVIATDGLNNAFDEVYVSLNGTQSSYCERGTSRVLPNLE